MLKNMVYFLFLVLTEIYHYWTCFFLQGAEKQVEATLFL